MRLLLCGLMLSCAGCTPSFRMPEPLLRSIEQGRVSPCHIVFVYHGMFYDLGGSWTKDLQYELAATGRLGIPITYYCDLLGVWFNYGSVEPARLTADLMQDITKIHSASGCETPLVFDAVGFSVGGEVILATARELSARDRASQERLRKVLFVHSSSFAFSGEVATYIDDGVIGGATNYFSPIDIVTLGAPLGAGSLGMHFGGDELTNEMTLMFHASVLIGRAFRDQMREALFGEQFDTPVPAAPSEFGRMLADYLSGSQYRDQPTPVGHVTRR